MICFVAVVGVLGMISALLGLVLFCWLVEVVFELIGSGFFLYLGGGLLTLFALWVLCSACAAP